MFDLKPYLFSKQKIINAALDNILQGKPSSGRLIHAMRYSLMAGGKRLRPVLCMAAAEAVGGDIKKVLPAACAIEMLHTSSLIHDDLPAMDNDKLRRGQPTCHIQYDEATAILAGDALLILAFRILSSVDYINPAHAVKWLNVVRTFADAAGYNGMMEGQMRDILSEGQALDLGRLEQMYALKTGALIKASIISGAVLGNGNTEQINQLGIYAEKLGLSFQVTDDILNIEGDPDVMGKAVGTDQTLDKSTYPQIMGLDKSKEYAKMLITDAVKALSGFSDNRAAPLAAIAVYAIERKR